MTYFTGNLIIAGDYMSIRGPTGPAGPYTSDVSAQGKIAALVGVGYGSRGYGLTTTNLVVTTSNVTVASAAQWNNIRTAMDIINVHTGSSLTLQPIVNTGDTIFAFDGQGGRSNIVALINTLDTNRLNLAVSQSTSNVVTTSTRTTAWTNSVYHEFTATFGTEDLARYFFNSGSEVRLSAARTGGSNTAINSGMTTMLTNMGNVRFGATTTTYNGTGGITSAIGYYGLTSAFQQVFIAYAGGTYPNMFYQVQARRENYIGNNGANGTTIRFRAYFDLDGYSNVTIDGTTISTIFSYRSSGVVPVSNPTYATTFNIGGDVVTPTGPTGP